MSPTPGIARSFSSNGIKDSRPVDRTPDSDSRTASGAWSIDPAKPPNLSAISVSVGPYVFALSRSVMPSSVDLALSKTPEKSVYSPATSSSAASDAVLVVVVAGSTDCSATSLSPPVQNFSAISARSARPASGKYFINPEEPLAVTLLASSTAFEAALETEPAASRVLSAAAEAAFETVPAALLATLDALLPSTFNAFTPPSIRELPPFHSGWTRCCPAVHRPDS